MTRTNRHRIGLTAVAALALLLSACDGAEPVQADTGMSIGVTKPAPEQTSTAGIKVTKLPAPEPGK